MIVNTGYEGNWFRQALAVRGTEPCIQLKWNCNLLDTVLCRQQHLIENTSGHLKGWRHFHTRYGCAHPFFSAIAATVISWLGTQ